MDASQRLELIQRLIPQLDIRKLFLNMDIRNPDKGLPGLHCIPVHWGVNMQLSFSRFTPQHVSPKIAPFIIRSCVMHELSNFHPSRRRLAAAVFDFDCASVHLLARFKVCLLSVSALDAGATPMSRAARRA